MNWGIYTAVFVSFCYMVDALGAIVTMAGG
jgi:hypothetical protein